LISPSIKFSGISSTLIFSISLRIWFLANWSKEFLYSSLICFEIKVFKSFKSLAPKFWAKSSLIFTSSGFLTFKILQTNLAFLFTNSFSGKFSGKVASTIFSSPFLAPINCLSKPFKNKSFPNVNWVFLPSLPLNSFPSTVAL